MNETYTDQMEKRATFLEAAGLHFPLLRGFRCVEFIAEFVLLISVRSEVLLEDRSLTEAEGALYTKMLSEFNGSWKGYVSNLMKKLSQPIFNPKDPYRSGRDEEVYGARVYSLAESTFRHAFHGKTEFMYWERDKRTGSKIKVTAPIRLVVGGL